MGQVIENEHATAVRTEAVTEAIRNHEVETLDWRFRETAVRMNSLFDGLNSRFFGGRLPKAVIAIGPDLIVRYGYYRIGRDEIGARHRIHLNARHFGRSESDVGVTLLHELLHLHQHLYGSPSKRARYHNKEFVDLAGAVGIVSAIDNGVTLAVSDRLRTILAELGFSTAKPMMAGADDSPIRRPLRKVMWQCKCLQQVWADRGVQVHAVCTVCGLAFSREASECREDTRMPFPTPITDPIIGQQAVPAPQHL